MSEVKSEKKVVVDEGLCIGCGSCVGVAPEYFEIDDTAKSKVIREYNEADKKIVDESIEACPVQAISIK